MGNCCIQEEPADEYNGGLEDFDDFDPFGRYAPKFGNQRAIDVSNCVVVDQSPTHVYAWHQHSGYRNYNTPPMSPPTFPRYLQSRPISIYEVGNVNYSRPNKWNDPLMDNRFVNFSPSRSRETSPMIIDAVFRPPSPVQSPLNLPLTSPTYNRSAYRFKTTSQPPSRSASPEPAMYRSSSWTAPRSRSPTPPRAPTPIPQSPVNSKTPLRSPVNRPPPLIIPTPVIPKPPTPTSPQKIVPIPPINMSVPQDSPPVPQTPPPQPYMLPPYEFTPSSPQHDELPSPSSFMSSPQHSAIMSKDARFEKLKEVQKVLQDSVQVIDRARTVLKTSEMIQAAVDDMTDEEQMDIPAEHHYNTNTPSPSSSPSPPLPPPPPHKTTNKELENYVNAPSEPSLSSNPYDVYIPYLPSTSSSPSLGKTLSTPNLTISPPSPREQES